VRTRVFLPVVVIAGVAAWLTWLGIDAIGTGDVVRSMDSGRAELVGPIVILFVAATFLAERRWPAEARPALARGHVHDALYLVLYAVAVVPLIVLTQAGFMTALTHVAPNAHLPKITAVPDWVFVIVALIAMDFCNWFAHWANHRFLGLWRLHAVHHAQEEMSVLTSFRAHPLVHVSFLISALPVLVLADNGAVPVIVIITYICLAALPHANVRWGFGPLGRVFVSPAFHRLHHSVDGRIDVNLGTILTVWDVMTRRAVFPAPGAEPIATGLAQRPIPVEQAGPRPRFVRTLAVQLGEPFVTTTSGRSATVMAEGGQRPGPSVTTDLTAG
jgi:sterol desaturase/sphingolipid hydroxylase (fatty acid hydroxylase superfamily)